MKVELNINEIQELLMAVVFKEVQLTIDRMHLEKYPYDPNYKDFEEYRKFEIVKLSEELEPLKELGTKLNEIVTKECSFDERK